MASLYGLEPSIVLDLAMEKVIRCSIVDGQILFNPEEVPESLDYLISCLCDGISCLTLRISGLEWDMNKHKERLDKYKSLRKSVSHK